MNLPPFRTEDEEQQSPDERVVEPTMIPSTDLSEKRNRRGREVKALYD